MITLPTPYTTGLSSAYNVIYFVRMVLGGNEVFLCSRSLTGLTLTYGGRSLSATTHNLYTRYLAAEINDQEVNGIEEIDFGINVQDGGGLAQVTEATLRFLNQQRFDEFISQFDIENQPVEIWEGFIPPSNTIEVTTDLLLRFAGTISEPDRWDYEEYVIRCYDSRHIDNRKIPIQKITESSFRNAPKDAIGDPLQIVIGDYHTENIQEYLSGNMTAYVLGDVNLCPTQLIDTGNQRLFVYDELIAGEVDNVIIADQDNPYFAVLDSTKWEISQDSDISYDGETIGSGKNVIKILSDAFATAYIRPTNEGTLNEIDHTSAIDLDSTNYVVLDSEEVLSFGFSDFQAPGEFIAGDKINGFGSGIDAIYKVYVTEVVGTITLARTYRSTGVVTNLGSIANELNTRYHDMTAIGYIGASFETLKDIELSLTASSGASCKVFAIWAECRCTVGVKHLFKVRRYLGNRFSTLPVLLPKLTNEETIIDSLSNVFVSTSSGIKYGSWISGRIADDYLLPGQIITQPAYAIEWILRNKLGISAINTDSFDAIGHPFSGTRWSWLIGGVIKQQDDALEILRKICFEFGLMLGKFPNTATGIEEWKLIAIPTSSATVNYTVTENDVLAVDGIPQFRMSKTSVMNIKNDFHHKHKINFITGGYLQEQYASDIDEDGELEDGLETSITAPRGTTYWNWLYESHSRYATWNRNEYSCEFIRDQGTACNLLKLLADWWAFTRLIVNASLLKSADTLALQVGDVVKFNVGLLDQNHQNVTKFIVTRLNYPPVGKRTEPFLRITAEEIPNSLTGLPVMKKIAGRPLITSVS